MSKRKTGLLIAFGAALGAAAACVSYYLKYKSFSDELDKDFHDYEDEDECGTEDEKKAAVPEAAKRSYITIDSCKCKVQEQEAPHTEHAPAKSDADITVEEDTEGTKE